jgi:murein DD-endopeptidase MepM/ murein hydrolase activator NlpD
MKKISATLLLVLAMTVALAAQTSKGIEGTWKGSLDAGGTTLRLVLTVSKSADGKYSGNLESVDQGSTIPVEVITVTGASVHLELKSIEASFNGKLNDAGTEIAGEFSQGGATLPLTLKREAKAGASSQEQAGAQTAAAKPAAPQKPLDVPAEVSVPIAPTAFKGGGGKTILCYEMHITNFSRGDLVLTKAEVLNSGSASASLASYGGDELAKRVLRPGVAANTTADKLKIGAGLRLVLYVWIEIDKNQAVPTSLDHRLSFKVGDYPDELTIQSAKIAVAGKPVLISPPLRGSEWLAANGPGDASGHRRALVPVGGGVHIAQRFAIDFVQLREDGKTFTGDAKDNKNYRCYGTDALAVADGTVVATKDGIPENVPGENSRAVAITLETVGGNHVILDLGGGHYAFYAHLQPGSLRVKMGDKVKRGQVLGLVGNSGNSTEPHLHFHISNSNSPLGSEGLPYALASFEVEGKGWGWKPGGSGSAVQKRDMEMPVENEVVRFPSNP